jgi:TRAP-type mannitol/chloroaromatic compound transport system permease small subunit
MIYRPFILTDYIVLVWAGVHLFKSTNATGTTSEPTAAAIRWIALIVRLLLTVLGSTSVVEAVAPVRCHFDLQFLHGAARRAWL